MSVIGRKPLVDKMLEGLSEENLAALKSNLDVNIIVKYNDFVDLYKNGVLGQVYVPTFNAIFIKPYLLRFNPGNQNLVPYLLHSDGKLDELDEGITILELRSALFDVESGGGSSLPEVTTADNEKVLEVIAGAWGTGRKKVNVIDAPTSTTLTDEQIEQFKEGVFINGDFLGFKNPIIIPLPDTAMWGEYEGIIIGTDTTGVAQAIRRLRINENTRKVTLGNESIEISRYNYVSLRGQDIVLEPTQKIYFRAQIDYYSQDNITSGDTIALDSNLGKAMLKHLDVEINGYRARYEYTSGNYVVYSSKTEIDSGLKLQVNMISYNTTNGELSFNQMTFTPDN